MDTCIFCLIASGSSPATVLYQDDDVIVFKDIHPQAPVHWMVVSKEHVSEFVDGSKVLLGKMFTVVKKIIKQERITNNRIVINGKGAALIDHLHIHVMGGIDTLRKL